MGRESCEACKETRRIFLPPPKGVLEEELFKMISCAAFRFLEELSRRGESPLPRALEETGGFK